jgi:hypothetical protein
MMSKVVGILTVILGGFLFLAGFSLGASDTPGIEPVKRSQNVEPATQSEAAPKILSVDPVFNFGEVKQGEKVEHVFQVRNTGTADLVIKRATGS